jgi:AraC family transcriptional regulator, regulatory protein of adaptative response / DNA-3-methyladenine glycosylase II
VARSAEGRLRRMFDVDADVRAIAAHLALDPSMASLVAAKPGLRVFGGWDGFEVAVRSIIGQQVTIARARALNSTLVDRCGAELPRHVTGRLRRMFPTAQQVVDADLSSMGMPGARVAALKAVARAAMADPRLFDRAGTLDRTIARLRAVRGIGDWTAHYIAMRACREPDAFPSSDVGLLRGGADASGRRPTPAALNTRADAWRPWRAYAAHQLWAVDRGSLE